MTGMPRIEIEFEFDMVFCFGIGLAPYAVCFLLLFFLLFFFFVFFFFFHSDLPSTHCTTCWKSSSYKHRVCRPSVRSSVVSL